MTQKKHYDGKTFLPLTLQKQIIALRKDIENNVHHAGANFEVVKNAYDEIQVAHGYGKSRYKPSCSGCTNQMNHTLRNWFKLYDQLGASEQRIIKTPERKPLTPVKEPQAPEGKEPGYKELLERFNAEATPQEKEAILKGRKTPKKDELIQYFNGK